MKHRTAAPIAEKLRTRHKSELQKECLTLVLVIMGVIALYFICCAYEPELHAIMEALGL